MNVSLSRAGFAAVVVLVTATAANCPRGKYEVFINPAQKVPDPAQIELALSVADFTPSGQVATALGLVVPIPTTPAVEDLFTIRSVPTTGLPPVALLPQVPSEALDEPGLYLGVFEPFSGPPGTYFVARIGDPRLLIAETEGRGKISGTLVEAREGVIATRIPFITNAELVAFEVGDQGSVAEILFWTELGSEPPKQGEIHGVRVLTQ